MFKNVLAIIGAVTVTRWAYRAFNYCVEKRVEQVVKYHNQDGTFKVPS